MNKEIVVVWKDTSQETWELLINQDTDEPFFNDRYEAEMSLNRQIENEDISDVGATAMTEVIRKGSTGKVSWEDAA